MQAGIYCINCRENNRIYIGSSVNIPERWSHHIGLLNSNSHHNIYLQFLLGGIFMYLYLNNLNLKKEASLLGAISFIFSGVFIAWGWWGNIIHTLIWLPLLLLCVDKIIYFLCHPGLDPGSIKLSYRFQIKSGMTSRIFFWSILFIFS